MWHDSSPSVAECCSHTPGVPPRDATDVKRIYEDCVHEANRFKWIESEKVGYDLGETAIKRWVRDHWTGYLRAKWLEHLQGRCFWIELDRCDYGLLQRKFHDQQQLLDDILSLLKAGQENLDVLKWANTAKIDCEPVIDILEALDINSRRLICQF